ncbi:166_t:CDS:2 [Entrophospora sp. SA101]|nr:166_t:CDS:2 [Entrophospora sp. SA101]
MPKREIPPIHPGEMLLKEFIKPYKITPKKLAQSINVAEGYIQELVQEKRNISPSLAFRLAFYFNTSPDFWMNLQQHYDLEICRDYEETQIKKEVHPLIIPRKTSAFNLSAVFKTAALNHSAKPPLLGFLQALSNFLGSQTKNHLYMPNELENFFADLQARGIIADVANLKSNFYQLKASEKQDFRIILLLGGATSKIGDPSDKSKERPQLAKNELKNYYQQIEEQITNLLLQEKKIGKLDFQPLELFYRDNPSLLKGIYQVLELGKDDP